MSLRLRLTLLYTTLLVGILFMFGGMIYWLVSVALIDQIDTTLTQNAYQIIGQLQVNENNQFDARSLASFRPTDAIDYQIWSENRHLIFTRPIGMNDALDSQALRATRPEFDSSQVGQAHRRVLTVPLVTQRGRAGLLQVGQSLALVDLIMRLLAILLLVIAVLGAVIASVITWIVNGQALAPLATATEVATQITRADDLSRRIPTVGMSAGSEVAQLIQAFNSTLERLEQLFTSQRRFLADVSHELRTPLTVIKGNVGLMRKMGEGDEESLESIETEVDRLTRMVGDLLLLAQAESGRMPLNQEVVELDTVLLEVFQQMRMLAGERVHMHILEIDQVQVLGDRDRLKQVLLNLVSNAIQYTPAGSQVSLLLRKTKEQAQLIVSDTGPGIPAADLPHIFERFYRGEKSRKRAAGSGFGLGLSIAYWIVRNHGGYIEVSSKEGQGTRFAIWLPLAEQAKAKQQ